MPAVPFLASPRLASPRYDLNGGTCIAIGGEGYCIVAASTRYVARRETRKKKTKRRDGGLPPLPWIFVLTNTSSSLARCFGFRAEPRLSTGFSILTADKSMILPVNSKCLIASAGFDGDRSQLHKVLTFR